MNEKLPVYIFGAGGHGKVAAQVLEAAGFEIAGFLDDSAQRWGETLLGIKILGGRELISRLPKAGILIAIGDNRARRALYLEFKRSGFKPVTALHPGAQIHSTVEIGEGTLILPGAVVNVDAKIGANCIVNTLAGIDHDCRIADHTHLAPRTCLGGGVSVGEETLIGIGSVILPGRVVGSFATVGGGAVVTRDVPDHATVVGVPAKIIKKVEEI